MIANDFLSHAFMDREWKRVERIANKILTSAEITFWKKHTQSKVVLFKFWVAKEASYKMAYRQFDLPRTFAPKNFPCQFLSEDQFSCQCGPHDYSGEWLFNEKGLLAVIQFDSRSVAEHFWVPYTNARRAPARHAMLGDLQKSHPTSFENMRSSHFEARVHPHYCRSYSEPWGVCSLELNS